MQAKTKQKLIGQIITKKDIDIDQRLITLDHHQYPYYFQADPAATNFVIVGVTADDHLLFKRK